MMPEVLSHPSYLSFLFFTLYTFPLPIFFFPSTLCTSSLSSTMAEVARDYDPINGPLPWDSGAVSDSDSGSSYFTRTMSPLPPDTDPLTYGDDFLRGSQFLKPRSVLELSILNHGDTSHSKTNNQNISTTSSPFHSHSPNQKLPPLAAIQSLTQMRHLSHPELNGNLETGNGHAPGPKPSSGGESDYPSNGQPAPLANHSNSESTKKFVNRALQNGISVNSSSGKPQILRMLYFLGTATHSPHPQCPCHSMFTHDFKTNHLPHLGH
jgi:hypothetical protein